MTNIPEFSVSEISLALKRTVETSFARVRVRGELSRVTIAGSGHMYSSLKDENAVLDAIAWRSTVGRLSFKPEEGLEVICTGKLTTYPGRSNYQIVIDSMEPAGEGALLKLLEERKKKLAAEGLFDESAKKPLPFLPKTIGIVTSPTGAVIRDIIHRLTDRFPVHVIVWPAVVQGQDAEHSVTKAIQGFCKLPDPPDLIIVARGGGSLEDLMPFSSESVVRAIAECPIPIISAVGHETDTMLSDYAADVRAPTPTAAAEMAVPVRENLYAQVVEDGLRLHQALKQTLKSAQQNLLHAIRPLAQAGSLLDTKQQRFDTLADKLPIFFNRRLDRLDHQLTRNASRIKHPQDLIVLKQTQLASWDARLKDVPKNLLDPIEQKVTTSGRMLETLSYKATLKRGYAVAKDDQGQIVKSGKDLKAGDALSLEFHDTDTIKTVIEKT